MMSREGAWGWRRLSDEGLMRGSDLAVQCGGSRHRHGHGAATLEGWNALFIDVERVSEGGASSSTDQRGISGEPDQAGKQVEDAHHPDVDADDPVAARIRH